MGKFIFATWIFFVSASAYAARPLEAISPEDREHSYYAKALNLDPSYRAQGLLGEYADYSFSGDHKELGTITGQIVVFNNGPKVNEKNLVLSVNGNLYYVETHLSEIYNRYHGKPFRLRRQWDKEENGIFLMIRGHRRDPRSRLRVPVEISIKIATVNAQAMPILIYSEDRI